MPPGNPSGLGSGPNPNLELSAQRVEPRVARETPEVQAWAQILRAHSALTRRFSTELLTMHGLTLNGYEVLLHLAHAPERRLRRVDLAESVLLTPSGITRLLDGLELERASYVCRATSERDARVSYAVLTDRGTRSSAAPRPRMSAASTSSLASTSRTKSWRRSLSSSAACRQTPVAGSSASRKNQVTDCC